MFNFSIRPNYAQTPIATAPMIANIFLIGIEIAVLSDTLNLLINLLVSIYHSKWLT